MENINKEISEFFNLFKNEFENREFMYISFFIRSFIESVREDISTSKRTIFNYWEVIALNLICREFDKICRKFYLDDIQNNDFDRLMVYINNEYFLDSFNSGNLTTLIASYKNYLLTKKKFFIMIFSQLGPVFYNLFKVYKISENMTLIDKILTFITIVILSVREMGRRKQIPLEKYEKEISTAILSYTNNISLINETNNLKEEIEKLKKHNNDFINDSIKKEYLTPYTLQKANIENKEFQSYFLSFVFSFITYNYELSHLISTNYMREISFFSYYFSEFNDVLMKEKIYNTKMKDISEFKLIPISKSNNIFECKNLTVKFKDKIVIDNFTMSFSIGNWITIFAESGKGKTTLCNAILGRIPNHEGSLKFCDQDYDYFNIFEYTSYVSCNDGIFKRSVRENCKYGVKRNVEDDEINYYLNEFNMTGLNLDLNADNLSTGQKQRLKIIRMLIHDRQFLFLDEITSNLDDDTSNKIINKIRSIASNKIVFMITHDKSLISDSDILINLNQLN